jgi:hypothetical protein
MEGRPGMPDPGPHRARIAALLRRLERAKEEPAERVAREKIEGSAKPGRSSRLGVPAA